MLICLFTKLQRHKKSFVFRNSVVKIQRVLFGNEPFLRKMLESFFSSNIPLYIGKNPVEKLLRFWKWNLKRTPQSASNSFLRKSNFMFCIIFKMVSFVNARGSVKISSNIVTHSNCYIKSDKYFFLYKSRCGKCSPETKLFTK